ncbi:MAG: hypothetical protein AABW88_00345 [Nanoarchaeota archaeon]
MKPLTREEIQTAEREWYHFDYVPYSSVAMERKELLPFFNELKEHEVLEIGPGNNPINKHFPCKKYSAALGYYPHDGLSLLRKKPSASAVVVSFGVIDDSILGKKEINKRYIDELVKEIRRVMNPFSIIFGTDAEKYLGKPDVLAIELRPDVGEVYHPK